MSELDLIALGIWRIPIPLPEAGGRGSVNVWAIEDLDAGITLFDSGHGGPESQAALVRGLAQAGATLDDVQRIILSHAHLAHFGGAPRIVEAARREVGVFASAEDARCMGCALAGVHSLREGDRFRFRRFAATALALPGHTAGLMGLLAEDAGILFSSDHLVNGMYPTPTVQRDWARPGLDPIAAYRASLRRVAALAVQVVLPGRGEPFGGHRRVVREVLAALHLRDGTPCIEPQAADAAHHAP